MNSAESENVALPADSKPHGTAGIREQTASAVAAPVNLMVKIIDVGSQLFKKRHPKVGARPGTLIFSDDASPTQVRMISYTPAQLHEQEVTSAAALREALKTGNISWVDVQGFGDETLIREIGDIFALPPLVMEDIVNIPQRPKSEFFESQIIVVTRMVRIDESRGIDMEQVTLVLGPQYVLTFQERHGDVLDPIRQRLRNGHGRPIRQNASDYLAYAIIDTIVDGYYPVIEALGDHLESLEHAVIEDPGDEVLRVLNGTKNTLVNLRRAIWPQRESVNTLLRDEHELVGSKVRTFLRDTYDHCVQTAEVIEMYREMATGLMNTYLSSIANRTNEVMKVLTIMASLFIPLTFLAGIYGMNFEHMPELHVKWAYPAVWVTMITVILGMLFFFRRRGWIGGKKHDQEKWNVP